LRRIRPKALGAGAERMFARHQERLVKDLALFEISDMDTSQPLEQFIIDVIRRF